MSDNPEGRPSEIKRRRLEISVALTASKAAYFGHTGESLSLVERSALESEDARLALEQYDCKSAHNAAKSVRHLIEHHSFINELLKLLEERGLEALAMEAHSRAIQSTLTALKQGEEG